MKTPSPSYRTTSSSRSGSRIDAGQGLAPHLWRSDGGELRTLRDAGNYIAKLPKGEQDGLAWRAEIEALMLVAEHGDPTMLARIAMVRPAERGEASQHQRRRKIAKKYMVVR
jgi:hypothetical protein